MDITAKTMMGEGEERTAVEHTVVWKDITTLDELVELCGDGEIGEGIVLSNALSQIVITIQSKIRATVKAGGDPQAAIDAYVPGVKAPRSSVGVLDKAVASYATMNDEDKEAFIKKLREASAG